MSGDWSDWIGREQRAADRLGPALAVRWLATFDLPPPEHETMPQGIHFCLCTPDAPTAILGGDGHPQRDESAASFLPPITLPRRMWAGSDIVFPAPIAIGAVITRTSRVAAITPKSGSRGDMVFVEVDHETSADGALAVSERQTLVFLEALTANAPLSPPEAGDGQFSRSDWDHTEATVPDERLLFRYSALTFNTHRIHYDAPYARDVERYRGLVVHGPLMASLLLQFAARHLGENALASFSFRGMSPAISGETLHLALRSTESGIELGAFASDGREVIKASATRT